MPTPLSVAMAWHADRLTLPQGVRVLVSDEPRCGFYKRRLAKGAVFVPARIWLEQDIDPDTGELLADEVMRCEVNGREADPDEQWSYLAGNPITEQEFKYLSARNEWAQAHSPHDPAASPREPIVHLSNPILF